jgi:phage gp36-like protein
MAFSFSMPSIGSLLVIEGGFIRPKRWGVLHPDELANDISPETLIALTDDDKDGVADMRVVAQIIENAEAEVSSFLFGYYDPSVKKSTDRLLRLAMLDYAKCFLFRRKPEYAKSIGKENAADMLFKQAERRMEKIQQATQKLPDVEPDKGPKNAGNAGNYIDVSGPRTIIDNPDGSSNNPMF